MENRKQFIKGIICGIIIMSLFISFANWGRIAFRTDNSKFQMDKLAEITAYLQKFSVFDLDTDEMVDMLYAGYVAGVGDKYTSYMPKEVFDRFTEEMSGHFAGIGVYIANDQNDNFITISSTIENSPAKLAGLKAGDKILKVDEQSVSGEKIYDAISMMKGPVNTKVKLTVLREEDSNMFDVEVKRAEIVVPTVEYEVLEDNIGYIKITAFEEPTFKQFMAAYNELQSKEIKGLILDVRNNLGGYLESVWKISDVLLPDVTVVYTENKEGKKDYLKSDAKAFNKPIVLLVNENSASASEILAGAIKDNKAGKLVGVKTFGKGLVQQVFKLTDGSAVKITVQKYFTPSGVCIQDIGIAPDYVVNMPSDFSTRLDIESSEDVQLQSAIEVMNDELINK